MKLVTYDIGRGGTFGINKWWEGICPVCGKSYRATRQDKKTCSTACRKRLSRATQESNYPTWLASDEV